MALDPSFFFYSDGTISLTNGSDIATGTFTAWDPAVLPFDFVLPNNGADGMSVIKEVLAMDQIRLAKPWTGPTLTDVPYYIVRWTKHTDPKVYALRVSEYLTRLKEIPVEVVSARDEALTFRDQAEAFAAAAGTTILTNVSFTQAGTGASTRTVQDELRETVRLKQYWFATDADYTNAFNRALAYLQSGGGGELRVGRGNFPISQAISVPLNAKIIIRGEGTSATVIRQTNSSAGGISFSYDTFLISGGGLSDLTIEAGAGFETAGFFGSGSTGVGVTITRATDNFFTHNLSINNFDTGMVLQGCWNTRHYAPLIKFFRWAGILWQKAPDGTVGAGTHLIGGKVSNNGYAGPHPASVGMRFLASGGEYIGNVDVTATNTGIRVEPTGGDQVLYLWFSDVLADTSTQNGWVFDGTNGLVSSIRGVNCWAGFCGENGLLTVGAQLDGVKFTNMALRQNKQRGWLHQGGKNIELTAPEIAGNSRTNALVFPGVEIATGANDWSILGGAIGNFANGGAIDQAEGLKIAGTSAGFKVQGVTFTNTGTGKSHVSYTDASISGYDISGNLPKQSYGLNASSAQAFTGAMLTPLAAGATRYLGPVGENINSNVQPWVMSKPGLVRRLYAAFGAAPGAGQTFTFTVMKNGAATGMTATATGAGQFVIETTAGAFTVSKNDALDIQAVSSAGAAAAQIRYYLEVEP